MSAEAKQAPLPLLVLGEARRRALVSRLTGSVRPWLRDWSTTPEASPSVAISKVADSACASVLASATRVATVNVQGVPQLYVLASDEGLVQVLGLPRLTTFADSSSSTSLASLALDVAHELVRSLAKAVADDAGLKTTLVDVVDVTAGHNEAMQQRHWWAATVDCGAHRTNVFHGAFQGIVLVLSPQLIATLAPSAAPARSTDLERRATAILEDVVKLQVVLGEAQLSVGELASLSVNDVIVLKEDLSQAASLLTMEGARVAKVSLGRVGNKRAVTMCR